MAELADAAGSKSADLRVLGVRLPLPAPAQTNEQQRLTRLVVPRYVLARRNAADRIFGIPDVLSSRQTKQRGGFLYPARGLSTHRRDRASIEPRNGLWRPYKTTR
jgi:hypothetical protein